MSDVPTHLQPIITDRGFRHMPPIIDEHGTSVRVYESSAADDAYAWLMITGGGDGGGKQHDDHNTSVTAHLTLPELLRLGEQIEWIREHHYQRVRYAEPTRQPSRWSRLVSWLRS